MMKSLSLGKKIKAIRLSKGFSQEDMAFEMNVSLATYSRIERDIPDVSISTLEKIARILKVTVIDILAYGSEFLSEEKYRQLYEDKEKEIRLLEKELRDKDKIIISKDKEIISLHKKLLKAEKKLKKI